jgi:hypothetical protein
MKFSGRVLVALVVLTVSIAGCGGGNGGSGGASEDEQAALDAVDEAAQAERQRIQDALALLNQDPMKNIITSPAQSAETLGGTTRCAVGFAADFPDYVLVTVVSSGGPWYQISVHPQNGVDRTSLNNGSDYRAAGFDEDFWASGYPCEIVSDDEGFGGRVVLAGP